MQLSISQIRTDGGTQPRQQINFLIVDEYAESMEQGSTLPPVEVYYDGNDYWLVDGFHRVAAARNIGRANIAAIVTQGTLQDAQWASYGVNATHGLRRTNEDKRRAVEAALRHPKAASLTNMDIARHCGVSEGFVRKLKPIFVQYEDEPVEKTVTRNGTTYQMNTANIGQRSEAATKPAYQVNIEGNLANEIAPKQEPQHSTTPNGHSFESSVQATPMTIIKRDQPEPDYAFLEPAPVTQDELEQAFNYKRDAKANRAGDIYEPKGYDACQTPPHAVDPLLPYLPTDLVIWEPAQGEGFLVEAFYDSFRQVIGSDILEGQNFFEYEPDEEWDVIVTNPPYSLKFKWLERCYELGRPFALLLPVETLGAATAQAMFKEHGMELLLLNKRVNFKMPNKGWDGAGAQFPVAWFTWGLGLEDSIVYGELDPNGR